MKRKEAQPSFESVVDFLIVDDEILIAESISEILKTAGYRHIRIATSVEEAVNEIELHKPDMVLTDINLNDEKSGIDLGKLLLKEYRIPFIYVTSHSSPEILNQAKHTRPNAYIIKPFKNEDLLVAIELALFNTNNKFENSSLTESLILKEGRAMVNVSYNNIMWLEAANGNTTISTSNGKKRLVKISLSDFEQKLNKKRFIRIQDSVMVNCSYITETRPHSLMINGHELAIDSTYQSRVDSYFNC
jgi:DNA-binding LytR/AlgR family response regulator